VVADSAAAAYDEMTTLIDVWPVQPSPQLLRRSDIEVVLMKSQ
jgi:hypothetical protein